MPQFAGTKQKVLEVFVQRLTKMHCNISGRGVVYPFDADGFLDVKTVALEGSLEISRFRSAQANVLDLNPSIKRRRLQEQYTWKPSKTMLDDVWSDIEPGVPGAVVGCLCYGHITTTWATVSGA